jgi:hypothetical protein
MNRTLYQPDILNPLGRLDFRVEPKGFFYSLIFWYG